VYAVSASVAPLRMLVRGVVVNNQAQLLFLGSLSANRPEELQPFLVSVPVHAGADDLAISNVERGKQRGCSVALVVGRHRLAASLLDRGSRLSSIQSLDR
jgi:hypothetical protein